MNSILTYDNFREYIRDYFIESKKTRKYFSFKTFADKAGFKSRDYILRVMNGSRNLSKDSVIRLYKAMGLSEKEADYFEKLVDFNQSKSLLEKENSYLKLSRLKGCKKHTRLREDQYEYLSTWYHCVIRALLPVVSFNEDYKILGKLLDPQISAKEARDSVNLLLRLGLIKRLPSNKYLVSDAALSTGDEIKSLAAAQFHKMYMDLARRSIDLHHAEDREISGLSMSISRETFVRIKSEIQLFRKKVIDLVTEDKTEDRTYHLQCHLFPTSKLRQNDA